MILKSRLLRRVLFVLALLAGTAYVAFSTLLFNPLEGEYEFDVSTLIARDVDFYVSKAGLGQDFDPLPRPAFADDFVESRGGQAVMALPAYRAKVAELGLEQAVADVEAALDRLPLAVDVLSIFGGRDLALAGYVRGQDLAAADWAAFGRSNWVGKLGVELLAFPGLIGLEEQGLTVSALEDEGRAVGHTVSGGELARPLHVTRVHDVIVVGTSAELVIAAHRLDAARGQDSLGQSAHYHDHITLKDRDGDELEAYVDVRALAESGIWGGRWPDPSSDAPLVRYLARAFQATSIRELIGLARFAAGVTLHLHGMLTSETMTAFQKRLYRTRGLDQERIRHVAAFVPRDAGVFFYGTGDVGELLREAVPLAEPALISNLEDLVRSAWGHPDLHPLIDEIDGAVRSQFAFVVRKNDYPEETGEFAPPADGRPVPIWALMLWTDDRAKIEEIQNVVVNHQAEFGIGGRKPGARGVYKNTVQGGNQVYEFHSAFVPGTGHVATVDTAFRGNERLYIVSNHNRMVGQMITTQVNRGEQLAEDAAFGTLVKSALPSVDYLLWLNPRAMGDATRTIAKDLAEARVQVPWAVERPRIEKKVLKEKFPGETWGALTPGVEEQLQILVQPELDAFERQFLSDHLPAMRAKLERRIEAAEIVSGALFELSIDQKDFDFYARLVVPFDRVPDRAAERAAE